MRLTRKALMVSGVLWVVAVAAGVGFWLRPVSYFDDFVYVREAFTGVENGRVTVEGHAMHYLAEGPAQGPVVVLVHGLGGRAEDWAMLAPYLAKAGFRVYMPDLPGYGRSERPAEFSYSVRDEAGAVVGLYGRAGIEAGGSGRMVDGRLDCADRCRRRIRNG